MDPMAEDLYRQGIAVWNIEYRRLGETSGGYPGNFAKGKTVWESNVVNPAVPHRLPNGHTLVGSMNNSQVAEYDRSGRQVWVYNAGGQVFNARGR